MENDVIDRKTVRMIHQKHYDAKSYIFTLIDEKIYKIFQHDNHLKLSVAVLN